MGGEKKPVPKSDETQCRRCPDLQRRPSRPARSTGRSLCPPPRCTRTGSTPRRALRMGTLRTACRPDATASQVTRTTLWLRQGMPTPSTPPSATASRRRYAKLTTLKRLATPPGIRASPLRPTLLSVRPRKCHCGDIDANLIRLTNMPFFSFLFMLMGH